MTRPSYFDPNVEEIPEAYREQAEAELPGADAYDVTERAGELWVQARREAEEYGNE